MNNKPQTTVDWAMLDVPEYILSPEGQPVLVNNKEEPDTSLKQSGVAARQPLYRSAVNYELNSLGEHIKYLYAGEVGDTFTTSELATTEQDVNDRFGGTWSDRGTDTFATATLRLFTRSF